MEMCPHLQLLLFLGITLRNIPEIAALEQVSCNKTQFLHEKLNICCDRCQPGYYVKKSCTVSTETLCVPCREGTYTSNWNYQDKCRSCYPCSKSLVEKEPCSSTHDTVCVCREGETCAMYDALGVCQFCEFSTGPVTTTPGPTESPPGPAESPPDTKIIWIVLGVALFIVTAIMVVICIKTSLLKRFGRMIKKKRSSESVPQTETGAEYIVSSRLFNGEQINIPLQEQGKGLCYPVQETDATQPGVISLLSN